jgi:hypothetical protein
MTLAAALGGAAHPAAAAAQGWRDQISRQISNSSMISSARREGYGDAAGPFYDLVAVRPSRSASFRVEVGMASCRTSQCGWGVAIVAK